MKKINPEDPATHSADVVADNVEHLRSLFPEAFTEGQVDFEVLKQLLGGLVDEREEKYGLNWHGKRRARQLALTPSTGTLRPCPEESVDWDTTQNLMIEGDNLEVLKLLQKSYSGKVKLIYIDPPYNTGKDFVYPDNFRDSIQNYREITGQVDGENRKISSNSEASGRFHTDWLNSVYPRLKLARTLLTQDGVLYASIDDNEVDNLRKVLDDIFGEENRIAVICHKARASVSNDKIVSSSHNFILLYARNFEHVFRTRRDFGLDPNLTGFDKKDEHGAFKYVPVDGPGGAAKGNPHYTFLGVTGYWRFAHERMQRMHAEGRIEKVGNGLQQKLYLAEAKETRRTATTWWDEKLYNASATKRLAALMGGQPFNNPKPVDLVRKMLKLSVRTDGDYVLDFFAGSGTTGHAVMSQNAEDGVKRRYILVQLPEVLEPENKDQKVAVEFCDNLGRPRNIAELTKERLRRAGESIKGESPMFSGDLGFRIFKLDRSNIRAWDPNPDDLEKALFDGVEHLHEGRSEQDVLYELLLKLGLDLCVPIEDRTIAGKPVHSIGAGTLLVCLAKKIAADEVEALALGMAAWREEQNPAGDTTVVFRDSAFADDVAKTNIAAILEQHGLETVRSL